MKYFYLLLMIICLTSCVSVSDEPFLIEEPVISGKRVVSDMYKIKIGMSLQEVSAILGDSLTVGYEINEENAQKLKPITIPQPYREEDLVLEGRVLSVRYYYTAVARADDMIAEDELTPLIFENGWLIGKGFEDLEQIKRK